MDIVKLIELARAWNGDAADIARILRALEKAENAWNASNDNTAIVVVKTITGGDLLAHDNGELIQAFIASWPSE